MSDLLMYTLYAPTWTARKLDKKATKQVKETNGVKDGVNAGNFNKLILPDCEELTKIQSYIGATRIEFYLRTAAWGEQRGIRVGKAENHMDMMMWFGDRKAALEPFLDALGAVYPAKIAQAEYDMHGLFDIEDYPAWDVVRGKFSLDLYPQPLPPKEDIRTMQDIPPEERKRIEDEYTYQINNFGRVILFSDRGAFDQQDFPRRLFRCKRCPSAHSNDQVQQPTRQD